MSDFRLDSSELSRVVTLSSVIGGVVWGLVGVLGVYPRFEWLLLLAPMVIVGLLVRGLDPAVRSRAQRLAILGQPVAALCLLLSFTLSPGVLASVLSLPWLLVTVAGALWGLSRLAYRGVGPVAPLAVDAGLVYLAVGGCWLTISRAGLTPMGFSAPIVLFTAIHFHYAGFAVSAIAGMAGRTHTESSTGDWWYPTGTLAIIAGPGLIAAGITLSPLVEIVSVVLLTTGILVFSAGALLRIVPTRRRMAQRLALTTALCAVSVSMLFAIAFGLSLFLERQLFGLTIERMVTVHGQLNAIGFALVGTIGWTLDPPAPVQPQRVRLSRLRASGRVTGEYVERNDLRGPNRPIGQLKSLDAYARADFDPAAVAPAVRRFYERTAEYELEYDVTYHQGFRWLGRVGTWITARIGQLALPAPDSDTHRTNSRIVDVDDAADGRTGVRAWIREDTTDGHAVFVAAYCTDTSGPAATMSIGLPLPWSTLSAVLWMDHDEAGTGIVLSSDGPSADAGLYLSTPVGTVRVPMAETFHIRPTTNAPSDCTAEHRLWVFGRPFLTIAYEIERARIH